MSSGASKDYNKKKDAIWAHGVSFCDGNTGVASCTANTPYSIGYSVLGDALDANLDIAVMGERGALQFHSPQFKFQRRCSLPQR